MGIDWQTYFWLWWILAVMLLLIDTFITNDVFLSWFVPPSVVMGFVMFFYHDLGVPQQIVIFSAIAVISIVLWETQVGNKMPPPDQPRLNDRLGNMVGLQGKVHQEIVDGAGSVWIGDCAWQVEGPDCPVGTRVQVTDVQDMTLVVTIIGPPADQEPFIPNFVALETRPDGERQPPVYPPPLS